MNVYVKPSLKNPCVAAALCLAVVQVWSFLSAGLADHPPQRGATPLHDASCRALFTITDVPQRYAPNASLFVHNRYGYVPADKLSVDWRARQHPEAYGGNDVAAAVQELLLKRDSPFGAVTTDYSPLAAVLPSVLGVQGEGEASTPTLNSFTRIGTASGLLPYVPCKIAAYPGPASVTTCFRARLAHQDTLWILFMGDSKIRILFYHFLARSDDELHYLVKFPNNTKPFSEMHARAEKLKVDLEASSATLPGLRVSFRFRAFNEENESKIRGSAEVRQLERWAAGRETPPHLLVVGYGAWLTQKMELFNYGEILAMLMDFHQIVAPLLDQISYKARVVVTSQNRYKIFARTSGTLQLYSMPQGDPIFDWSEAVFLHHLRRSSRYQPPPSRHGHHDSQPRDHLVPDVEDSGVWWWDTSLPLSLAENRECEELNLRGLTTHPVYKNFSLKCTDNIHSGFITYGDQVTMLLNLVCNSVLGVGEGVCCG